MAWNPQFWSEHQVSYHFGKPWPYPLQGFIPNWATSLNQWEIGLTKMKNCTTKLLCFKSLENFVLKIIHCGHNVGAHMKKIGWICPGSRFFLEKKLKKCPDQKMTKGKIVLELVKYAKSVVRKFRPIRGLHSKSHDHNGGLWLVEIF